MGVRTPVTALTTDYDA
jgi:hypothetical protein